MKTLAVLLPMLGLATIGYGGQTNDINLRHAADAPPAATSEANGVSATSRTNAVSPKLRIEKSYGGALPEIRRRKMQILKSPPQDRTAAFERAVFENVSVDPITGRAEGIILFSIRF